MSFSKAFQEEFAEKWNALQTHIYNNSKAKGFWENDRNDGEAIMLIVTELAEAVEALRKGNPASDKIKDFTLVEEELADAVIRLLDLSGGRKWDIVGAMMAKMSYNANRPYKHGKTF